MKKTIISATIILCAITCFAQSDKYVGAMKANIAAIDTSFRNPSDLLKLSNTFERIAMAEKNQWLPYYYAALMQVNYGFISQDKSKTDLIADKAASLINKADSLLPGNSEISTVKSMIASCRLMVDPMNRYMEYGPISAAEIDKAIQQDPSNPRPYYLRGQGLKYTPEQFGGGCFTAKPVLQSSLDKYNKFKPASDIHPNWGMKRLEELISQCK